MVLFSICILMFLVGGMKGISDLLNFKFMGSIFRIAPTKWGWWVDPVHSWENKWAKGLIKNEKRLWYYLWLYKPKFKERFMYSSTILVGLTDLWHAAQFMMLKFMFLSVFLHRDYSIWDLTWVLSCYLGFWVTYESRLLKIRM